MRNGEVVVLRDAFKPAFAEAAFRVLNHESFPWSHNEDWFDDGYAFRHSNVYDKELWGNRLSETFAVFDSAETKAWMQKL